MRRNYAVLSFMLWLFPGCGMWNATLADFPDSGDSDQGYDTGTGENGSGVSDGDGDTDADGDTDVDLENDTGADTGGDTDFDTDSGTDGRTDSDTNFDAESDADADMGSDMDADTDSDAGSSVDTGKETGKNADSDTSRSGNDTSCRPGVCSGAAFCDEAGNVACLDECEQIQSVEICVPVAAHGVCQQGVCGCEAGFGGSDCTKCVETNGGVETCDGKDNDCNGYTDEAFDFDSHPSHCGGCGKDCFTMGSLWGAFGGEIPDHMAQAACRQGRCEVFACDSGFTDDPGSVRRDCDLFVKQIAAGSSHTCILVRDSEVWCWGSNLSGQLGCMENVGTEEPVFDPQKADLDLSSGDRILDVAMNSSMSCAVLSGRTIRCWGSNRWGTLGTTDNLSSDTPNPVPVTIDLGLNDGVTIRDFSVGNASCVVLSSNIVRCWGMNDYGQLGVNENVGSDLPVPDPVTVDLHPPDDTQIVSIWNAGLHTCSGLSDNRVFCWGENDMGQLGNEDNLGTFDPNPTPAALTLDVQDGSELEYVRGGVNYSGALLSNGEILVWGDANYGAGDSHSKEPVLTPIAVKLDVSLEARVVGYETSGYHSCAALSNNSVHCWGRNQFGELGREDNTWTWETNPPSTVDLQLDPGVTVIGIATGGEHTCALMSDVSVQCWGRNSHGQLGRRIIGEEWTHEPGDVQDLFWHQNRGQSAGEKGAQLQLK